MEQRCNPGGLLGGNRWGWTALPTVGCEAASHGPSLRMAIGVVHLEQLLFGVVLITLFLGKVNRPFATVRPECGVLHWPPIAVTGLTHQVLFPREPMNFSQCSPRSNR